MYLAGIDIGTTSLCCVVIEADGGRLVRTVTRANDSRIVSSCSWEELQDPARIVDLVEELLRDCSEVWEGVKAVGISCQMHGIVYVDRNGHAVSPLFTWQDGRGGLPYDSGLTYAAYLKEATGYPLAAGYGMTTHFYNVRNNAVPPEAACFCTIGDYIAMKLCGGSVPLMDASNAAGLGLFSLAGLTIDLAAMEKVGMDPGIAPRLAGKEGIAGTTRDGKTVACAIGDNQASFLGAVPSLQGTLLLNVGTGAQVSVFSETFRQGRSVETRPFPGGGYLLVGSSLGGGKSYALLERFFREVCRTFGPIEEHGLFDQMNRMAEEAISEDADFLQVGTQFYGTRRHPELTGSIGGITERTFTPKHLAAGFLDGIVRELLEFTREFPEHLRRSLTAAAGSGNGIRRNPAMRLLLHKRLNLPVHLSAAREEAAFGAALHAGVCCGSFAGYEEAVHNTFKEE